MYQSAIEIFQTEWEMKMEGEVMKAVCKSGVHVDKEELLKALRYDREQYDKGYQDGLNADKWIPCEERLPSEKGFYLATVKRESKLEVFCLFYQKDYWLCDQEEIGKIIAWQPLPTPYKKEGAE